MFKIKITMVQEAYVSYEVAKLLKEKGFDEPCYQKYDNEGYLSFNHIGYVNNEKPCNDFCALAPTHQMAMAWLREVHKIFIEISVSIDLNGNYHYSYFVLNKNCEYLRKGYTSFDWTYEEAIEAALKYYLENLI